MNLKKLLFYLIVLVIVVGGGFLAWKYIFKKEEKQSDISNSDNPMPNPDGKLTEQELEKYLLEKRLDLQKYFVFNLGELKTIKEKPAHSGGVIAANWRFISQELSNDLTKITASYGKFMEKKGMGYQGTLRKELICFFKGSFTNFDDEYSADSLDQKITNEKDLYLIFEKYDDEVNVYFNTETDDDGKILLVGNNLINIRTRAPTTKICKGKSKALEIIKADPTLVGKV